MLLEEIRSELLWLHAILPPRAGHLDKGTSVFVTGRPGQATASGVHFRTNRGGFCRSQ